MSNVTGFASRRITKSNTLIKASYRLTLEQQRLILASLAQIDPRSDVPRKITIYAQDYARAFGLCMKSAYCHLRAVSKTIYERDITLHDMDRQRRMRIRWVKRVDYFDGEGRVDLYFSDKIKVHLGRLSGYFSSYYIEHVSGLSSNYAIRLYEMIVQWADIRQEIEVSLADFRDRLQVTDRYRDFDNLRRRVIEPALLDLNRQSNFNVQWQSIRRGRSVMGLRFFFEEKSATWSQRSEDIACRNSRRTESGRAIN